MPDPPDPDEIDYERELALEEKRLANADQGLRVTLERLRLARLRVYESLVGGFMPSVVQDASEDPAAVDRALVAARDMMLIAACGAIEDAATADSAAANRAKAFAPEAPADGE